MTLHDELGDDWRTSVSTVARMSRAFPWMLALSPQDGATCARDLLDAARASFSTDQPNLLFAGGHSVGDVQS